MKQPPIEKIYEALTAIASNRVEMKKNEAFVSSSNYQKSYHVTWYENQYASTDNASIWQGYPGYPIIAVLLLQEKLPYQKEVASYIKDINWHEINNQLKRNYDQAIEQVLSTLDENQKEALKQSVKTIYKQLLTLRLKIVRKVKYPS